MARDILRPTSAFFDTREPMENWSIYMASLWKQSKKFLKKFDPFFQRMIDAEGINQTVFDRMRELFGAYSQYGQDVFVDLFFKKKSDGVFVEIGAFDGKSFSNCLYFEEKGWRGVAIEPNPVHLELLKKNRTCPIEQVCIAEQEGTVSFFSIKGKASMLSGIASEYDPRHVKRIERETREDQSLPQTIQVPAMKLNTVLAKHGISSVDYLSIDTEGNELKVLKGIDFGKTQIKLISVEVNYGQGPDIDRHLLANGYQRLGRIGCDVMYVLP